MPEQAAPAPDNTKVNERDRSKSEPTADQQKENRSDRDITQQIRQSIMSDKSLSTYAQNVKIITQSGQVTLKGPVRSDDEKRSIEAKAIEVAGQNRVTSELNIKLLTRSAAASDATDVSVSKVVNFSGRATVTYSVFVRRQEKAVITTKEIKANRNRRKTIPPLVLV